MPYEDEELIYSLDHGCPSHGDDHITECSVCGNEFCSACTGGNHICSECQESLPDDDEENVDDFEDVKDLGTLLGDDTEADKLVEESEGLDFGEDLDEDEDKE